MPDRVDESSHTFIVIEGPVGAGKTTVQQALAERLRIEGYSVGIVGEFSDTEHGRQLGTYFDEYHSMDFPFVGDSAETGRTQLSAVAAQLMDIALTVEQEVVPQLAEHDFVLKERFTHSTRVLEPLIYEQSYDDPDSVVDLIDVFERTLPVAPDHVFYLDVPRQQRLQRIREKTEAESHYDDGFKRIESRFDDLDGMTTISNDGPVEETVAEIHERLAAYPVLE